MNRIIYLLDSENVADFSIINILGMHNKAVIFFGSQQKKLPLEIVIQIQELGNKVKLVQTCGTGKNALDFHIAYYIGKYSEKIPNATFVIISKDKGYDPLISHLNSQGVKASREESVPAVTAVEPEPVMQTAFSEPAEHLYGKVLQFLEKNPTARPTKRLKLHNTIKSACNNQKLQKPALDEVFRMLEFNSKLTLLPTGKIQYHL